MKYPQHLILDVVKKNNNNSFSKYWIFSYISNVNNKSTNFLFNESSIRPFFIFKNYSFLSKKFFNFTTGLFRKKKVYKKIFKNRVKVINASINIKNIAKHEYYLLTVNKKVDKFKILSLSNSFKKNGAKKISNNKLEFLFNIYFLKKEKIYTKLKYSRTPQYDIVSGGAAAFLAGFLGFLISEKFGIELVDSGDFYFLFMYSTFFFFFAKLIVKNISFVNKKWSVFSIKWGFTFFNSLFFLTYYFFFDKISIFYFKK